MELFPAIDLRGGKVVRLRQGDFRAETVYGEHPVEIALSFERAGARWIHVVDLDAAKTGEARNRLLVGAIAEAVEVPVQAGGGVRDRDSAEALLDTGVARIVVGTAAHEQPGLVEWLASRFAGRVAVGLDGRGGKLAVRGWQEGSDAGVVDTVRRFADKGVAAFIVTDIERDGMLNGPDVEGLAEVLGATEIDIVASGGVSSLDDLRALAGVSVGGYRSLAGVIVGKALYEGRFSIPDALEACRGEM